MSSKPRPHLSAALAHLRFSVLACALVLGAALTGQVTLFVAVHLTDARKTDAAQEAAAGAPARVVQAPPRAAGNAPKNPDEIATPPTRADVNSVPGESDVLFRRASSAMQTAGIISSMLLALLMFQGVYLAGAASIPGVEKAVSASTLALAVMLLCLPLTGLFPGAAFGGVFIPYAQLVQDSDAARASSPSAPSVPALLASHLLMPMAVLTALVIAVLRFRSGVEAGIIVTAVSELDEKLEREIRAMKTGQLSVPRAVGALNMAIGAAPSDTPLRDAAGAEGMRAAPPAFRRPNDEPAYTLRPGDSTKRPI